MFCSNTILHNHASPTQTKQHFSTKEKKIWDPTKVRNVAIIAHVDHGKTTLVDQLLQQSGENLNEERAMDSNQLEKERGITILSKITSIHWGDTKINIVDTPGHGDFGAEVERIVGMVDGCVLLVDASEGVMAQTKFVLSKALQAGLKPIVVLNKMDRSDRIRPDEVENEIFELFMSLGATEEQMNYPTLYAAGRAGWAVRKRNEDKKDMSALFQAIVDYIPSPKVNTGPQGTAFSMLVTMIDYDQYLGRILTGKIHSGSVFTGMPVRALDPTSKVIEDAKVFKIVSRKGLDKYNIDEAFCGDLVGITGFTRPSVSATICDPTVAAAIPSQPIDPPVLSILMTVTTSPLAGKEGKTCTFPMIKKRLFREAEGNVSIVLKQEDASDEAIEICGRGELQLGILLENMRREGFEMAIFPPKVVMKNDESGNVLEPLEEVTIDVDDEYTGSLIEKLALRKGELVETKPVAGKTRMEFLVPSRGLLGFRTDLMTETRGTGVMNTLFHSYVPYKGDLDNKLKGAMISMADGVVTAYALESLQDRGVLFISPGDRVFVGMVVGEHSKVHDLEVNPTKQKALSNVRSVQKEDNVKLTPPRILTLEQAIAYMKEDECLEITPSNIRLKKVKKKKLR